jgi:hypothetical protein
MEMPDMAALRICELLIFEMQATTAAVIMIIIIIK